MCVYEINKQAKIDNICKSITEMANHSHFCDNPDDQLRLLNKKLIALVRVQSLPKNDCTANNFLCNNIAGRSYFIG